MKTDNQSPAAPVDVASPAPTTANNSFSATWSLPADAGTPIVAARYQVCQGSVCGPVRTAPRLTGVSDVALPSPGGGTLRVWLLDGAGHEDASRAATLALAYAPPPAAAPEPQATPAPVVITPTPPTTVTKISPSLRLTTLQRLGRRVTVAGRISPRASGRVTVRYRVTDHRRARTVSHRAMIRRAAFRLSFTLPASLARVRAATVAVAYAGDADTHAQTRTAALRLLR